MSSYVFLVGKANSLPVFSPDDSCNEIVYALAAIPVSWYALFEESDLVESRESADATAHGNGPPLRCVSLVKNRQDGLALFAKRKPRLLQVFPKYVAPLFDAFEKTIAHSTDSYLQLVLSDLDDYLSNPKSALSLRNHLKTIDGDDLECWSDLLMNSGIILLDGFGKVKFQDDEVETLIGYVPDEFAVTVYPPVGDVFKKLRQAAKDGDAEAQYHVALAYNVGAGVKRDRKLAWEFMQKAAEQELPIAQAKLGTWHSDAGNFDSAALWWRKAAEQGWAESQHNIGYAYRVGKGVPLDLAQGLEWTRKASAQGFSISTYTLSEYYATGKGVEADQERAFAFCKQAAQEGFGPAQLRLAKRFEKGEGIEKDLEQAVHWYQKAGDSGDSAAEYTLGYMYMTGRHVPRDFAKALYLFQKSSNVIPNGAALCYIGHMYENGLGVEINLETAFSYYCQSVIAKNIFGAMNLGRMYRDGRGVKKDIEMAKGEFRRALQWGHREAEAQLKALDELS